MTAFSNTAPDGNYSWNKTYQDHSIPNKKAAFVDRHNRVLDLSCNFPNKIKYSNSIFFIPTYKTALHECKT